MKKLLTFLLVLLTSFFLFALGQKEDSSVTHLTWWHSNSGNGLEATEYLVNEFNETIGKEKNIVVEAIFQGKSNDVLTKVKGVSQANDVNSLPDIVQLDASGVVDMTENKYMYPVEDLAKANGEDLSFLLDSAIINMSYKGKVIGLPFNSSSILYYYNKTVFDSLNLLPPTTLAELSEIAPKLVEKDKNGKITRYAFTNAPTTYELVSWLGQQNGHSYLTDNDNGHNGTPNRVIFDENNTLSTFLTEWENLNKSGGLESLTSGVNDAFVSGRTASIAVSTSNLTTILDAIDGRFELGVAYLPKVNEEATGGVNIGGGALFTFDKSEKNEAIWTFLKFLTSKESQFYWHTKTGYLPVNKDTYSMNEFLSYEKENPIFSTAYKQVLNSNPEVVGLWIPSAYQVYYSIQSNIVKFLDGKISKDETVKTISSEINSYLDDFHAQND